MTASAATSVTSFNLAISDFTTVPTYVPLPISLSWNLTSSIAISPTTINQTVQVVDLSAGLPVVTLPVAAVAGQSAYSFTLTPSGTLVR